MVKLLHAAVLTVCMLITSCSKEEICNTEHMAGKYLVTINSPSTRALDDQVQGGGKYSDGETVSLYTTALKFTAEANGSAGGKWLSDDPQSRVTLTSGINQDWSVTIKDYYCDVTFNNTAMGGDGTIKTEAMKFGEKLPIPATISGYIFDGWYDGDVKIATVSNSPNKTVVSRFKKVVQEKPKIVIQWEPAIYIDQYFQKYGIDFYNFTSMNLSHTAITHDYPYSYEWKWEEGTYSLDSYTIKIDDIYLVNHRWENSSNECDHGVFNIRGYNLHFYTSVQMDGPNINNSTIFVFNGDKYYLNILVRIEE